MTVTLDYEQRQKTGKQATASLRKKGLIPGVIYGNAITPIAISLKEPFIRQLLCSEAGKNTLITFNVDNSDYYGLIHDVKKHPITGRVLHIDFLCIDTTKPVTVSVPLVFEGIPRGVKVGGLLLPIITNTTAVCLPHDIPSAIRLDITGIGLGQSLKLSDITPPESVQLIDKPSQIVIKVAAPKGTKAADIAKVA